MFIFLIDANSMVSLALETLAKKRSERFYTMTNLPEALYFIEDLHPDVLVLDGSSLPVEAPADLLVLPWIKSVPVVGLGAALPTWASVLNVKGHIPKPLDPFQFTALVRKWLQ
jgi:chemotaxis response regulator CheB